MKNKKYIALLIAPLLLGGLASCQITTSSETSSDIAVLVTPDYVIDLIKNARKSYTLKSKEVTHVLKKGTDVEVTNSEYLHEVMNMSGETNRIYQRVKYKANGNTVDNAMVLTRDERGFACEEKLDYQNKVSLKPILVNGSKINYDVQFFNPFAYIDKNDIKPLGPNTFSIDNDKKLIFTHALNGNDLPLKDVQLNFENGKLKNITTISEKFTTQFFDKNTEKYIAVDVYSDATILLNDVGTTKIPGIEPIKSRNKEKEDLLKSALESLGNNYTIITNEHDRDIPANPEYNNVWYFNGKDAVYHQHNASDQSRKFDLYYKADKDTYKDDNLRYYDFNETKKEWEYNIPKYSQSYNTNPQPYDYFALKNETVAPELFKYDEANNVYVCDSEDVIGYIGNSFLPGCYSIAYFTLGQGDKCEIKLNSSNKIKEITVGYTRTIDGYDVSTDFTMNFLNIGKTKIPTWVEGK